MAKVYGLYCEALCLYVGSTIDTLNNRAINHRSKSNTTGSRYIPKDCEWRIVLLEECDADTMRERERYYYDILKPFYNNQSPTFNINIRRATASTYYHANSIKILKSQKIYIQKQGLLFCFIEMVDNF